MRFYKSLMLLEIPSKYPYTGLFVYVYVFLGLHLTVILVLGTLGSWY